MKPFALSTEPPNEYHAFLQSEDWKKISETVKKRDGYKCQICGSTKQLQAHHIRYQDDEGNRAWAYLPYIVTLCRSCHEIITGAVEKGRRMTVTVPAFDVSRSGVMNIKETIDQKMRCAVYGAEAELVADVLFDLWRRTLKPDAGALNFRNRNVLKPIAEIVIETLRSQACRYGSLSYDVAYEMRVHQKINDFLARGYNYYRSQGCSEQEIMRTFKLPFDKVYKIREQAARLLKRGADDSG